MGFQGALSRPEWEGEEEALTAECREPLGEESPECQVVGPVETRDNGAENVTAASLGPFLSRSQNPFCSKAT